MSDGPEDGQEPEAPGPRRPHHPWRRAAAHPPRPPLFSTGTACRALSRAALHRQGGMGTSTRRRTPSSHLGGLKVLRPDFGGRSARPLQARDPAGAASDPPNVCRIFDLGRHALDRPDLPGREVAFLTMELLPARPSRTAPGQGRMTPEQALPLVAQMVSALSAAHRAGWCTGLQEQQRHARPRGGRRAPVRAWSPTSVWPQRGRGAPVETSSTPSGFVLGTPAYLAPEQVEVARSARQRHLRPGVVLYEMVTATAPFSGSTPWPPR